MRQVGHISIVTIQTLNGPIGDTTGMARRTGLEEQSDEMGMGVPKTTKSKLPQEELVQAYRSSASGTNGIGTKGVPTGSKK